MFGMSGYMEAALTVTGVTLLTTGFIAKKSTTFFSKYFLEGYYKETPQEQRNIVGRNISTVSNTLGWAAAIVSGPFLALSFLSSVTPRCR